MGIGAGLIEGASTDLIVGIRPGDLAYVTHSGAVYHPQDESGGGNVPYYDIQNTSDEIDFDVRQYIFDMDNPTMVLYSNWGPTDFDVVERTTGNTVISEQSGYDTTGWTVTLDATDGKFRLTNFDTNAGVDGTQAGWYPFVGIYDRVE